MKNFAIFSFSGKAPNKGGPIGYLWHLYSGFTSFEPDLLFINNNETSVNVLGKQSSIKKPNRILYELKSILSYFKKAYLVAKKYRGQLKQYQLIHVHESDSVFYLRLFCGYRGKIILTSHRPEPLANEVINAARVKVPGRYMCLSAFLNYLERYSYNHADGLIFPSPCAKAIYNDFPGFIQYSKGKPVKFLTTGLNFKASTVNRAEFLSKYKLDINKDKKIITYIGRHNLIKGYDRIIAAYPEIKQLNGVVIVAGAISEIKYPNEPDWIELGYINDAMNLMAIADVVVIPNRNTYFDLVIIEALSLGKIVVTSNTGGNIDIAKSTKGLYLFDNNVEGSCTEAIKHVLSMGVVERKDLEECSRRYYLENCTPKIFAENYLNAINDLLESLVSTKNGRV